MAVDDTPRDTDLTIRLSLGGVIKATGVVPSELITAKYADSSNKRPTDVAMMSNGVIVGTLKVQLVYAESN